MSRSGRSNTRRRHLNSIDRTPANKGVGIIRRRVAVDINAGHVNWFSSAVIVDPPDIRRKVLFRKWEFFVPDRLVDHVAKELDETHAGWAKPKSCLKGVIT